MTDTDTGRNMPRVWDPYFIGCADDFVMDFEFDARVELQKVIPRFFGFDDFLATSFRSGNRIPVEGSAGSIYSGAYDGIVLGFFPEFKVPGMAQHTPDRGDAIGYIEEQNVLDPVLAFIGRRYVGVHFSETGSKVFSIGIDDSYSFWPGRSLYIHHIGNGYDPGGVYHDLLITMDRTIPDIDDVYSLENGG